MYIYIYICIYIYIHIYIYIYTFIIVNKQKNVLGHSLEPKGVNLDQQKNKNQIGIKAMKCMKPSIIDHEAV